MNCAHISTIPVPVATCGCCCLQMAARDFDALPLAAGHHGDPAPVGGIVCRLCVCGSSVSVRQGQDDAWLPSDWPTEDGWEDGAPGPRDEVPASDPADETEAIERRREVDELWERWRQS